MSGARSKRYCRRCGAQLAAHNSAAMCAACESASKPDPLESPQVPDEFWAVDSMSAALRTRHMGKVITAYRRHPYHRRPLPQEVVGGWVNMTQPQVSKIENGPAIRDLDKLTHWAITLRIPESALWFRLPVVDSTAPHVGIWLPGQSTGRLAETLEFEPHLSVPGTAVGELGPVTLGHEVIEPPAESTLLDALQGTLDQYIVIDNLLGPRAELPAVPRQAAFLQGLLAGGGRDQASLLPAAARFAEFTGWLYQDAGFPAMAMRWTDQALELAELTDDAYLVSYIWMRKSNIGTDAGQSRVALRFANVAMLNASHLAPRLRAVAFRQEAQAQALAGDADACARALDNAREEASRGDDEAVIAQYCTPSYVEMEAAHCWIELSRPERALTALHQGLSSWQPNFRRDLGLCLARLALAYAQSEAPAEAVDTAHQAVTIARQTQSYRTRVQLHRTADRLVSVGANDAAHDLRHMLAAVQ